MSLLAWISILATLASCASASNLTEWTTAVRQNDSQKIEKLLEYPIQLIEVATWKSGKLCNATDIFWEDYAGFLIFNETQDREAALNILTQYNSFYHQLNPTKEIMEVAMWLGARVSQDMTPVDGDALVLLEKASALAEQHLNSLKRIETSLVWETYRLPTYIKEKGQEATRAVKELAQIFLRQVSYVYYSHDKLAEGKVQKKLNQFVHQLAEPEEPEPEPTSPEIKEWQQSVASGDRDKVEQLLQTPLNLITKIERKMRQAGSLLLRYYDDTENYLVYNETISKEAAYDLIEGFVRKYEQYDAGEEGFDLLQWFSDRSSDVATPVASDGRIWFERARKLTSISSEEKETIEQGIGLMFYLGNVVGRKDPEADRFARRLAVILTMAIGERSGYEPLSKSRIYLQNFLYYV